MSKEIISKLSVGDKVGRLTVLEVIPGSRIRGGNHVRRKVRCMCDCGTEHIARHDSVISLSTMSCGCSKPDAHGGARTTEYYAWQSMKSRCYRKRSHNYRLYGARGITVCDRWKDSFQNFFDDMGKKPSKELSLDRIDNDGNYEPSNCRWATPKEQTNNRRVSAHKKD